MEATTEAAAPVRFAWPNGLRAAAACAIVAYEVASHAGADFGGPSWARVLHETVHGFDALLVLSGMLLAYPILAARRCGETAKLGIARFYVARIVRIAPATLVVIAAALWLQSIAGSYGISGLGGALGNDGVHAVAAQARVLALFPLLLALYLVAPLSFAGLGTLAIYLDLATPLHRFDVGAATAFMIGIAAADVLARGLRKRFALPIALTAAAGAVTLDPMLATLSAAQPPGALQVWDPLWAIAVAALAVGCARNRAVAWISMSRPIETIAGGSFALILVAGPASAIALHARSSADWLSVVNALGLSAALALVLWFALDRFFAGTAIRQRAAAAVAAPVSKLRSRSRKRQRKERWKHAMPAAPVAAASLAPASVAPAPLAVVRTQELAPDYGPLPIMLPGMLATVSQRVGSLADLRAEIEAARLRILEASAAAYYVHEPMPGVEPELVVVAHAEPFEAQPEPGCEDEPLEGVVLPPEPDRRRVVTLAFSAPRPNASVVTVRVGPKMRNARAS